MRTVAIIQARMGSSRLPGKVLMPLAGRPALAHVVERVRRAVRVQRVVVATTLQSPDDALADWCREQGLACFRGSENDVLDRYYRAACAHGAEAVVRITADCPVVDPAIIDEVVEGFAAGGFDLYGLGGEFPDGLDCAVLSFRALEAAWHEARLPSEREHVCPWVAKHPEHFRVGALEKFTGLGHHRWTLDEEADYRFLSAVFDRLHEADPQFATADILGLLEREPALVDINRGIVRNEGYLKSLEQDRQVAGSGSATAREETSAP